MKKKRYDYKIIFGFMIGMFLVGGTAYATGMYQSNEVIYELGNTTITSTNVQDAIDELATKYATLTECPREMVCTPKKTTLSVGDYIRYYPNKTVAYTDPDKTGYGSQEKFNPSELTLWRVVKLNQDGTIDIISDNVSTNNITFKGLVGLRNLVGHLNELASEYENDIYTVGSRYFGYNGQTEFITGNLATSWEDQLYTNDYNLVRDALGTVVAKDLSDVARNYWIASREYDQNNEGSCCGSFYYYGKFVSTSGAVTFLRNPLVYNTSTYYARSFSLRPIVTLKATGLTYFGGGTKDFPMEIYTS